MDCCSIVNKPTWFLKNLHPICFKYEQHQFNIVLKSPLRFSSSMKDHLIYLLSLNTHNYHNYTRLFIVLLFLPPNPRSNFFPWLKCKPHRDSFKSHTTMFLYGELYLIIMYNIVIVKPVAAKCLYSNYTVMSFCTVMILITSTWGNSNKRKHAVFVLTSNVVFFQNWGVITAQLTSTNLIFWVLWTVYIWTSSHVRCEFWVRISYTKQTAKMLIEIVH